MKNEELIQIANRSLLANYRQAPVVLVEGKGCRVEDADGKGYLDLCAGIAVVSVGHGHPRLAQAICEQAGALDAHLEPVLQPALRSSSRASSRAARRFARFYFCNSGAEANESLFKLARRYHYDRGDKARIEIVTALSSFHGRTHGRAQHDRAAQVPRGHGAARARRDTTFPTTTSTRCEHAVNERTAAVVLEPIQGEGGVVVGADEYLQAARELCDERGALLMFDEVQTCYGRTGRFLGREHSGVVPDACALAKGIAARLSARRDGRHRSARTWLAARHARQRRSAATRWRARPRWRCSRSSTTRSWSQNADARRRVPGRSSSTQLAAARPRSAQTRAAAACCAACGCSRSVNPAAIARAALREQGVLLSIAGGDVLRFYAAALRHTRRDRRRRRGRGASARADASPAAKKPGVSHAAPLPHSARPGSPTSFAHCSHARATVQARCAARPSIHGRSRARASRSIMEKASTRTRISLRGRHPRARRARAPLARPRHAARARRAARRHGAHALALRACASCCARTGMTASRRWRRPRASRSSTRSPTSFIRASCWPT